MTPPVGRGTVYRCLVCGAEVLALSPAAGKFIPRCCNKPMVALPKKLAFCVCPVCGAEIAVLREGSGEFSPRCCNTAMQRIAA